MKTLTPFLIGLSILLSAHSYAELISETLPMDSDGFVSIEVLNGDVTLVGWDRNEFKIEGKLSENAEGYELEENNGNISFAEEYEKRSNWFCWFGRNCSSRGRRNSSNYEIFIPNASRLVFEGVNVDLNISQLQNGADIETINGAVTLSDIVGDVDLETVNGEIEVNQVNGKANFSTVNGRINIRDSSFSRVTFDTVNGRIDADIQSPRIHAKSLNGRISIESGSLDELEISTLNGRINLELSLNDGAEIDISSFNGDINLKLPANTSARFEIKTKGRIDNELSNAEPENRSRYSGGKELVFASGDSSSSVEISSFSGRIELEASAE